MASERLKAALEYAERGWAVFPLNGKRPFANTGGFHDATTNARKIERWWKRYDDPNIGVRCDSATGPIVVDIDGPTGIELLKLLELPAPLVASSGRANRRHLYYGPLTSGEAIPRTIKVKHGGRKYDFDILGDGGYVVLPPSIHPETGKSYRWRKKGDLIPCPDIIAELVQQSKQDGKISAPPLPAVIGQGERDTLLTSLAGSMRRRGASEDAILAALREENATRVDPPLPDGQLRKIARSIAKKTPAEVVENLTDLGNARRFVAQHSHNAKNVGGKRGWVIWEGSRWARDETGEADRMAKAVVRSLWAEAAGADDDEKRDAILKFAARSESATAVRSMLELASTEPEIASTIEAFDTDPWLFNVENGTINLRTGKFYRHRRDDLLMKMSPVEYDPSARAYRWEQFLMEIMDGDTELVEFLQRAVGYAMTGDTREQCLFFCYGRGSNGKSTLFELLRDLFGDYAQQSDFSTFLSRAGGGDSPRSDLARMRGARLVTAGEADHDKGFDGKILKQLTGNDTIMARHLYENFFEFKPQHKLFLMANHKPIVREQTTAFWRRMRLIPFTVEFKKVDKKLPRKLQRELPGILNWAIEGCQRWLSEGLNEPEAVRAATADYRDENDTLGEFFLQACKPDPSAWVSGTEFYRVFNEWWLDTRGPRANVPSLGWFVRLCNERSDLEPIKRDGMRGWSGMAIRREFNV